MPESDMSGERGTGAIGSLDEAALRAQVRDLVYDVIKSRPATGDDPSRSLKLVADLGCESLTLLELAFALEDEFDLAPIDEKRAREIVTVDDVEEHVVREYRTTGRLATSQP
jgi:acyl carrier protein